MNLERIKLVRCQPEALTQNPLCSVPAHRVPQSLSRRRYSKPMIGKLIWQNKRGNEKALVPLSRPINTLEIAAASKVRLHLAWRLIVRGRQALSAFGPSSL